MGGDYSKTESVKLVDVRNIFSDSGNNVLPAPVLMATVTKNGTIRFSWNRVLGAVVRIS